MLAHWRPRLLPGAVASATHGLIRTGHAVCALREQVTEPRLEELGQALGYWAARWQPLPGDQRVHGTLDVGEALDAVPVGDLTGGIRTRLELLGQTPSWPSALGALRPMADPVHAATAPRAIALALPATNMPSSSPRSPTSHTSAPTAPR